jgi:hypothetical protein
MGEPDESAEQKESAIFGGFTPLSWDSTSKDRKSDDSLKSFLFTLKNPHNIPARKFALKTERKRWAIVCDGSSGPKFAGAVISNNCNANTDSRTLLGNTYSNDTDISGNRVFTGSKHFKVKEIEVFEIPEEINPNTA